MKKGGAIWHRPNVRNGLVRLAFRQQNLVDHVDDAIGRLHVSLGHHRVVDCDAIVEVDADRVTLTVTAVVSSCSMSDVTSPGTTW